MRRRDGETRGRSDRSRHSRLRLAPHGRRFRNRPTDRDFMYFGTRIPFRLFPAVLMCMLGALAQAAQPNDGDSAASKFLRFVPDKHGGGTLQASAVRYENADGVSVDLVAAVHIAEPSFF